MSNKEKIYKRETTWGFPLEVIGLGMRLIQASSMFLVSILLARELGPVGYGVFSYAHAWILLVAAICHFGLPTFLIREVAAYNYRQDHAVLRGLLYFPDRLLLVGSIIGIMMAALIAYSGLFGRPDLTTIVVGLPIIFLIPQMAVNESIARGFGYVLLGQLGQLVIRPSTQLLLLFLTLLFGMQLTPVIAMLTLTSAALIGFVGSGIIRKLKTATLVDVAPKVNLALWWPSLLRLTAVGALGALAPLIGTLTLGATSSEIEVGYFSVAMQLTTLISIGLIVINAQLGPAIGAAFAASDFEELQRLAVRACRFSLLIAIPISVPAIFVGGWILVAFYGEPYRPAASVLMLLALAQVINATVGSATILLVSAHMEKLVLVWHGISLCVQVILSLLLIPSLGAAGAAIAATCAVLVASSALSITVYYKINVVSLPVNFLAFANRNKDHKL